MLVTTALSSVTCWIFFINQYKNLFFYLQNLCICMRSMFAVLSCNLVTLARDSVVWPGTLWTGQGPSKLARYPGSLNKQRIKAGNVFTCQYVCDIFEESCRVLIDQRSFLPTAPNLGQTVFGKQGNIHCRGKNGVSMNWCNSLYRIFEPCMPTKLIKQLIN